MTHPYESRTRNRDRSLAQQPAQSLSPISWIVAAGFIITLACVVYPIFQHVLGRGL